MSFFVNGPRFRAIALDVCNDFTSPSIINDSKGGFANAITTNRKSMMRIDGGVIDLVVEIKLIVP